MATVTKYNVVFCMLDNSQFNVNGLTLAEYQALIDKAHGTSTFIFIGTTSANGQYLLNGAALQRSNIVRYNTAEYQETVK